MRQKSYSYEEKDKLRMELCPRYQDQRTNQKLVSPDSSACLSKRMYLQTRVSYMTVNPDWHTVLPLTYSGFMAGFS